MSSEVKTCLAVRKVLFETHTIETPYSHFGSCFLATLQGQIFVLTAYHLVGSGGTINWKDVLVMLDPGASEHAFGFDLTGTNKLEMTRKTTVGEPDSGELDQVLDFAWARVRRSQIDEAILATLVLFDLENCLEPEEVHEGLSVNILGYAEDSKRGQQIDYESKTINLWLHSAVGEVKEAKRISKCIGLEITTCSSDTYDGFSGSPAFVGSEPHQRLVGLAVMGSASIKSMNLIPAHLIRQLLDAVTEQYPEELDPVSPAKAIMDIDLRI